MNKEENNEGRIKQLLKKETMNKEENNEQRRMQ